MQVVLAHLPAAWRRVAMSRLSTRPITAGADYVAQPRVPNDVRYVRTTDVKTLQTLTSDESAVGVSASEAEAALATTGDILMTRSGSLGTSYFHQSSEPVCFAGYLVRMRPDLKRTDGRFLAWWASSQDHKDQIAVGATRSTIDNFSAAKFRAMRVPLPPLDEQRHVADFLDRETAQIDALIEKQGNLISTLVERRTALIRHAIGGGATGGTLERRSQSWLGPVPEHWSQRPLWSMFRREKRTGFVDEPMVSVFREFGVVFKGDFDNLNVTAEDRSIYQLVEPGWLVVNRMKAWQGSLGISAIRGISSGHYICFRPMHSERPDFLNWLFRSPQYREGLAANSRGVRPGQAEIDNLLLRQMPVLVPPLEEQTRIVDFLERETSKVDELIARSGLFIELARERRAALITAAVTGQLDVTRKEVA
ncbi:restriction endonuclease subunit S [Tessaracoccus antarcticus]|uniref:Type I restriction modification DNA specificity domain-containing protein n=1 Tax=Tessaracoccus antarcticus TaxID=2479848 RepID=A0A3M0G835_9ACTN|nr:restriction endonuclease subunit S [Tessaracoccus antarcticus]RMB57853.1 hypothetical protein EAX62_15480 [Tessaracoccus antarcticus]